MKRIVMLGLGLGMIAVSCKKETPPPAAPRAPERREEARRPDAPRADVPSARVDAPRADAPRPEATRADAPRPLTRGPKAKGDGVATCPVSGEKIGEGGMKPAEIDYKGRKVRFCCAECVPKFKADPDAYLKE